MNDRELLICAICASPDEDTPRLAFADWCDENGEPERAEFIRVQCAIAALSDADECRHGLGMCGPKLKCPGCDLRRRERKLLKHCRRGHEHNVHDWAGLAAFACSDYEFTRGFVSEIHLPTAAFLEHAASIFAAHPVTRVRLDRSCLDNGMAAESSPVWWRDGTGDQSLWPRFNYYLPAVLFDRLRGGQLTQTGYGNTMLRCYSVDTAEGDDDLCSACVTHGRALVGLDPLPTPKTA